MIQQILLGVDIDLSPTTQTMLQVVRSLLQELAPQGQALLLTVIPVPYDRPSSPGRFRGQAPSWSATTAQRTQARHTLHLAQTMLVQGDIAVSRLETLVREGLPSEELVKVATERQAACIILGYRGAVLRHRLRRLLLGSTTAQILRKAPCPILLVPLPAGSIDLVAWYEAAITRELSEHTCGLSIFTPEEVASRFSPLHRTRLRHKDVRAAKKALQQLADQGVLICQQIKGTWQCFND